MKTRIFQIVNRSLATGIIYLGLSSSAFAGSPENDFHLLKQRNGIDLYYRWMTMPEGNKVRQMKAVMEVSGTTEDLLILLKDEGRALNWIPSAEQFRNLTQISGPEWASYIQFATPWPFADQDCILEYKVKKCTVSETWIDFRSNPDYLSPVDGISRMKDIVGSFVIRPLPNGHCVLECYFLSTKASRIPTWITDPIITGSLLSLVEAMRTELNEF
jgi:hypothetical protein